MLIVEPLINIRLPSVHRRQQIGEVILPHATRGITLLERGVLIKAVMHLVMSSSIISWAFKIIRILRRNRMVPTSLSVATQEVGRTKTEVVKPKAKGNRTVERTIGTRVSRIGMGRSNGRVRAMETSGFRARMEISAEV